MDNRLIQCPNGDDEEPEGVFYVVDMVVDNHKSNFVAVSFAYKHVLPEMCFKLPFVCLYLSSTRPHFSMTFISIIDSQNTSNDGIRHLVYPEELRFNHNRLLMGFVDDKEQDYDSNVDDKDRIKASCATETPPVQLAVRWSNKVVSISPCLTEKVN